MSKNSVNNWTNKMIQQFFKYQGEIKRGTAKIQGHLRDHMEI